VVEHSSDCAPLCRVAQALAPARQPLPHARGVCRLASRDRPSRHCRNRSGSHPGRRGCGERAGRRSRRGGSSGSAWGGRRQQRRCRWGGRASVAGAAAVGLAATAQGGALGAAAGGGAAHGALADHVRQERHSRLGCLCADQHPAGPPNQGLQGMGAAPRLLPLPARRCDARDLLPVGGPQDGVVTEFRGQAVRPSLADMRERSYRAAGESPPARPPPCQLAAPALDLAPSLLGASWRLARRVAGATRRDVGVGRWPVRPASVRRPRLLPVRPASHGRAGCHLPRPLRPPAQPLLLALPVHQGEPRAAQKSGRQPRTRQQPRVPVAAGGPSRSQIPAVHAARAARACPALHATPAPCSSGPALQVLDLDGGEVRLVLCARADIRAGQELSLNYRFAGDGEAMRCACGAPECRGVL
jgi:hypothetical protein